ncbi:DUF6243 family protein [Streptomyces sp. NPDC049837]|uniref:DUF6243 family protein n=1 Tax=Streptomyces sp. NPDC049837 TaxID=3155277 RepID=UPI003426AE40
MARGAGGMLGVGGTRSNLSRTAMRGGGGRRGGGGGGLDPVAQKRELLKKLKEARDSGQKAS